MAQTSVRVRTVQVACVAVGWTGHRTLTVDRPEQAGGMGLGFNGGELLLLAIGGGYLDNIFRGAGEGGRVKKNGPGGGAGGRGGGGRRAQKVHPSHPHEAEG